MKKLIFIIFSILVTTSNFAQSRQTLDLYDAIKEGNFQKAKKAIEKGADINGADNNNAPTTYPLIKAVKFNRLEITKLLLERGANPNIARPIDHQTPIMIAIKHDNAEMTELLVNYNCNVNEESLMGRNALNISALWNSVKAASILLEKTNIDVNNRNNLCPLAVASRQGHIEMVKLLIFQTGIKASNLECINSAREMAKQNKHIDIEEILNRK